jgi:broad-specificity NMP kinase
MVLRKAAPKRNLILLTGIAGTGKTTYADEFAKFGFTHPDLENEAVLQRLFAAPSDFIAELLRGKGTSS